jgi:glycosyltransferase involved in cell wall biosynthesis
MRIGITIATYQRKDGKTPEYLNLLLESIYAQTYQDFKIYLIGDKYENMDEWCSIIRKYSGYHLCAINLNHADERDKYNDNYILWHCGGVFASNFGANLALSEGIDFICHIDHDDYIDRIHLEKVNKAIEEVKADWICSKSEYVGSILPVVEASTWEFLPFLPLPGGIVNSSVCYNYRKIPFRYRDTYAEFGTAIPSDADLWQRCSEFIKENSLISCLINQVTCYHQEEGYVLYDGK